MVEQFTVAADHQAEAVFETPDASRGANVQVADALLRQLLATADGVLHVAVAAVDQDVARRKQRRNFFDGRLRDRPGGDHQPDHLRRRQLIHQLLERGYVRDGGVSVVGHDFVSEGAQALRHPGAHSALADHADRHWSRALYNACVAVGRGHRARPACSSRIVTRVALRPSAVSDERSPRACAAFN